MKDLMIIPTYNGIEMLEDLIFSTNADTYLIFTHSNNQDTLDIIESIKADPAYKNKIIVKDYRKNRGLAKSWNEGINWGIKNEYNVIIVSNDDILFYTKDDYYRFVKEIYEIQKSNIGVLKLRGHNNKLKRFVSDHGFAIFGVNINAFQKVGGFDENYIPAYFEDLDYANKLKKHNYVEEVSSIQVDHYGSHTLHSDKLLNEMNHKFFLKNKEYYYNKWGENK